MKISSLISVVDLVVRTVTLDIVMVTGLCGLEIRPQEGRLRVQATVGECPVPPLPGRNQRSPHFLSEDFDGTLILIKFTHQIKAGRILNRPWARPQLKRKNLVGARERKAVPDLHYAWGSKLGWVNIPR